MTNKQSTNAHNPQIEHSGPRRINWFLVWLILAPFALLIGRELSHGGLIGCGFAYFTHNLGLRFAK